LAAVKKNLKLKKAIFAIFLKQYANRWPLIIWPDRMLVFVKWHLCSNVLQGN